MAKQTSKNTGNSKANSESVMTDTELLHEINRSIRGLLVLVANETLPEDRRYGFFKSMSFTSGEISRVTGIPESTIRTRWNGKHLEGQNGKGKQ
jgi:hypothetical protein